MAKTVRITMIIAACGALGLIILIASTGIASDKNIEKFLNSKGVAEQMQSGAAGKSTIEQETPLIRQAKAFALRINPPPPPEPVAPPPQQEIRPKVEVSAKFKLVGTSYYADDEAHSWALIDEVGKGGHWVHAGEKIGYLMIDKIGDGVVLIRDGNNTYELEAERAEKPNYVKSFSGIDVNRIVPEWQGKKSSVKEAFSQGQTVANNTDNAQSQTEDANALRQQVENNVKWLQQLQTNPESLGMTKEEANELGNLGEFLKTIQAEVPADANEPNKNAVVSATTKQADANSPQINKPAWEPNQVQNNVGPRALRRIRRTR